ncbi:DUF732 domain-containing protein [Mycobacterium helveticum]|uniref:DUF732 domain-containing protein n=1 Tax=Mycobacterium helveticum TaxID=2592811 RepID=A0A557XX77_9MYCO|nr:DUF732 domain-containing protein [Mycobacterium helveticum]TVS85558.1 DUF732 domain-containing protein [Mycobacterium helveticum]TVS90708.1 DUF732 domain-containing protein [Mycobacterium helveticum]
MTRTMARPAALPAGAGIVATVLGPGLPRASADPPGEEFERLASRYAQTTCAQLGRYPEAPGVNAAVADTMDRSAIPRAAAQRVVGLSVRDYCPQYLPLVRQVVPDSR